jgi:hypothetical protein
MRDSVRKGHGQRLWAVVLQFANCVSAYYVARINKPYNPFHGKFVRMLDLETITRNWHLSLLLLLGAQMQWVGRPYKTYH